MSEKKRGYYPEMLIDVHNLGKIPLKDYAKDDPSFVVARLCGLSKHYYRREDRIAELGAEVGRLREAANWVLHVANGVGKGGGKPSHGEHEASLDALMRAYQLGSDDPDGFPLAALSPQVGEKKGCEECQGQKWLWYAGAPARQVCPSCNGTGESQ